MEKSSELAFTGDKYVEPGNAGMPRSEFATLVDSLAEHEILENLLEDSKPTLPEVP